MMHPLLAERRSHSIFDSTHLLTDDELHTLLEAARWAPSAGNSQPWAYVVCRRGDENHQRFLRLLSRGNSGWVPTASAVLVSCAQVRSDDEEDAPSYSDYAEYDAGQASALVSVQARAMGLETHQFAGFDHEAFEREFGIPARYRPLVGIAIGSPATPEQVAAAAPRDQARENRERTRRPVTLL